MNNNCFLDEGFISEVQQKYKDRIHDQMFKDLRDGQAKLTINFGKDESGRTILKNLPCLKNLLIAGKNDYEVSGFINNIIIDLAKDHPDSALLIIIGKSSSEMRQYEKLPHLLIPVENDPSKAIDILEWLYRKMVKLLEIFERIGVRNLDAFTRKLIDSQMTRIDDTEDKPNITPSIVVIVNELADLMECDSVRVEEIISKMGGMASRAGIYFVLATQKPTADVLTGIIKANVTNRIAFATNSSIDSRMIIDATGAEDLSGKGDMLFSSSEGVIKIFY